MKLVRSTISKIGFAENKQTDYNDGLHFFFGKNNSGKTLIAKSFVDTLYPDNPSLIDSDAWDTMFATFTLHYSNTRIDIQRKGNKEIKILQIASNGTTLQEETFPLPVQNGNFPEHYLSKLRALFNKDAFSILSYIPSPLDAHYYNNDFSERIKTILLLDRSLYYCAFTKLFYDKKNETHAYHTHLQAEIQNKIKHCRTKLDLIELKEQKQKKHLTEIQEAKEKIAVYTSQIAELQKKIEACNRYSDTLSAIHHVSQQVEAIDTQIKKLQEKITTIENYTRLIATKYPQFKDFSAEKRNNIHTMQNIYRQIQAISEEIETIIFEQENKNHALARNLLIINIVLALGVLFVFLKPLFATGSMYRWILVALLILTQISSVGYYLIYTIMHSFKKIVLPLQQQKETYQIKLETLLNQNDISLDGITIDEIYEFLLQYFEEYNEYNEKQIDLLTIQKEVDESTSLDELNDQKRKLEDTMRSLHNTLNSLAQEIGLNVGSGENIADIKKDLQNELEEKMALIVSLQKKCDDMPQEIIAFDDEKNSILNEIAELEKELNTINEKNRLLTIITNSFTVAAQRYYNDKFAIFTEKIKTMVQDCTKNKFGQIDEEYIKKIITNSTETSNASLKYYVYVAAVFVLYELLQQELPHIHLPLIIDDPFVLMDEDAMNDFACILAQWASNRQVIVFTHNSNIKKMGTVSQL
ncbi:MAG: hypothetical protein N3F66_05495 [Spirochaetes bacterium]|nr:hypothetical protein [Spirochaetota bacterium]